MKATCGSDEELLSNELVHLVFILQLLHKVLNTDVDFARHSPSAE